MEHILIVGGTGMLAGVTHWLNGREYKLSIIARDQVKLRQICRECKFPDDNHLISLDYGNSHQLRSCVRYAQMKYGRFTMVVAWIHSTASDALRTILDEMNQDQSSFILFHILGSGSDIQAVKIAVYMSLLSN